MSTESPDELSLVATLAFQFVQKVRKGQKPSRAQYLAKLPDESSRSEFNFLVDMDGMVQGMADASADLELKRALSELPRNKPDIPRG